MPIITISRGSYSRGKHVAEKLAERLGYQCASRDILLEASKEFNIPEIKLIRALHDSPTILEKFRHGKDRYLKYFRSALLSHMLRDNIVYHGLAGHFFLQDISHVIKVRIIADMKERVAEEMARENIGEQEARQLLVKDDEERRKWGRQVYGVDTWDSRLYDMVINIKSVTIDDAVDILADLSSKPVFQTTPESLAKLQLLAKLAELEAALADHAPTATCRLEGSILVVASTGDTLKSSTELRERFTKQALSFDGIESVRFEQPLTGKDDYVNTFYNLR
ncbi:AAA family ATPase [Desulfofustis glycolicus]|uniref:Cytidylate kinase n=1 Tax=Desulfofustis glycolicus DSM 9705 TaxID=1121409 RepID=A0A1M5TJ82_9BACT|nr:cytidylate kinase-like family protein [Desulfofustis glycolicus]MCB2216438.1 cytidylate kinase-like family protein [Desulfobulbaceae bacterium]SHH50738.1 Cytidylate kinase [Desulfofustis glycolicus DSM 9705]